MSKFNENQMFEVRHLNDKHQSDLNVKLFDVRHSDVEHQNDMNAEHQTVCCSTIE